ncbi:MAG: hypothetical protein ACYCW6_29875, partial [Candidatus Xenobia bacterium]
MTPAKQRIELAGSSTLRELEPLDAPGDGSLESRLKRLARAIQPVGKRELSVWLHQFALLH